jgi:hypothetical protein
MAATKPGFPLQVLGFAQDAWASSDFAKAKSRPANANPAGFPLQSLARRQLENQATHIIASTL